MQRKRIIALFILLIVFTGTVMPLLSFAAERNRAPSAAIRVGCAGIKGFIEQTPHNGITGYGVAYLEEIGKRTGWRYTYRSGSWSECMQMLENGEIDLLLPAERNPEREKRFLFSDDPCCVDFVGLYTLNENQELYFEDYESFEGMRVGMIKDNYLNEYFFDLAEEKEFSFTPVYYNKEREVDDALERGRVDAVVNGNLSPVPSQKLLARLGILPAYFVTDNSNKELMQQLNEAVKDIHIENPYFDAELYKQYYDSFSSMVEGWTREEAEFIRSCPPLRVRCDTDSNPIEWYDKKTGEYKGIYVEILKMIAEESGLKFEFITPDDTANPWNAVRDGRGDLLSAAYSSEQLEEIYNMCFTNAYYPEKNSIISRRGQPFNPQEPMTIALLDTFISTQYYIMEKYPQWKILPCKNLDECMQAVQSGAADLTMTDTITLPYNDYLGRYPALSVVSTMSVEIPMCIGISKKQVEDAEILQSVMNKAIRHLSPETIEGHVLSYTIERAGQVKLSSVIRMHPVSFFFIVCGVLLLLFVAALILYGSRLKSKQNLELEKKNRLLIQAVEEAEHARDMYDGLYNTAVCGIAQFEVNKYGKLRLLNANQEARVILNSGMDLEEGRRSVDLRRRLFREDARAVYAVIRSFAVVGDRASIEFRIWKDEQRVIWVRTTLELIERKAGCWILQSTFMDITESKQLEAQLKMQSEQDSLTMLFNKGAMEQRCREYLSAYGGGKDCAYCILDIDNFKEVNDTYGHWIGDGVLKQISGILQEEVGDTGFIGRFGGDEFVIFLHDVGQQQVKRRIKTICSRLTELEIQQKKGLISGSAGIAMGRSQTYEELFEKADQALYRAKQEGKNCFRFQ